MRGCLRHHSADLAGAAPNLDVMRVIQEARGLLGRIVIGHINVAAAHDASAGVQKIQAVVSDVSAP